MKRSAEQESWAELSRVIVCPKWRGLGLSKKLIRFVLKELGQLGVDSIVLECLEIHVPLYERLGFSSLNQRGASFGIAKTMVGMSTRLPAHATVSDGKIDAVV